MSAYEPLDGYSGGAPNPHNGSDVPMENTPVNLSRKEGYEALPGATEFERDENNHNGYEILGGSSVFDGESSAWQLDDQQEEFPEGQGQDQSDETARCSHKRENCSGFTKNARKSRKLRGNGNSYIKLDGNSGSEKSSEHEKFAKAGPLTKLGDYSCFDGKADVQDELATVARSSYVCTFQGIVKFVEATLCLIAVLCGANNDAWAPSTTKTWFLFVNISAVTFVLLVLFVHWCRIVEKFPSNFQKLVLGMYVVYDLLLLSAGFLSTITAAEYQRDAKAGWELIETSSVFTFFALLLFIVDTPLQYKDWRLADLAGNLAGLTGTGTLYKGFTYHI